jgi:hypothetical protein
MRAKPTEQDPVNDQPFPGRILIIRHAEKPGDPREEGDSITGKHLSRKGFARAAALPLLFPEPDCQQTLKVSIPESVTLEHKDDPNFALAVFSTRLCPAPRAVPPRPLLPIPDYLIAAHEGGNSNRAYETIIPLASCLKLPIDNNYSDSKDDIDRLADDVLRNPKFIGKCVLICWHHGKIANLAHKLGVKPKPDEWDPMVFDRIWSIHYKDAAAQMQNLPERLLHGDADA